MKKDDITIRTITIHLDHLEIQDALIAAIYKLSNVEISTFDKFRFEFIKEGSPEYNTNKIRCTIIKQIQLDKTNEPERP